MLVYLNGEIRPRHECRIDPFDRGFLLGDGLYEGLRAFAGRVVAPELHVARLRGGLAAVGIPWDAELVVPICAELLAANTLADAFLYLQVTRGAPAPTHPVRSRLPHAGAVPTVFAYAVATAPLSAYPPVPTKSAITMTDPRWMRGEVKSTSLMGGVLAAIASSDARADDAILIREVGGERRLAESTSANVILVFERAGRREIVTPSLNSAPLLAGVTRDILLAATAENGLRITERPVLEKELAEAAEILLVGTLTMVTAVTSLDGHPINDGRAGPVAHAMLGKLTETISSQPRARGSAAGSRTVLSSLT